MPRNGQIAAAAFTVLWLIAPPPARAESLTSDQAVSIALARNRDVIAARFEIEAAELDRIGASIYPNPIFSYTLGNLLLGAPNPGDTTQPGFFSQTVHSIGISGIIDVWGKRHARMQAADRSLDQRRLLLEDALREIVYAVRSAFNDVVRENASLDLVRENRSRYDETIRISRARRDAGDISEAELRKIELEGLRYQNAVIDEEMQLDLARQRLAALLALGPESPIQPLANSQEARPVLVLEPLFDRALRDRPDLRAVRAGRPRAQAVQAQARAEARPDISLGLGYTHSEFLVSGDNPNALAVTLSLPVPLFDRNQANVGRAGLDLRKNENEAVRLAVLIRHDVADAVRRVARAAALLDVFEGGGMLDRADNLLKVAEKSYKAGSSSLLEFLEAQRTYIETREQYLKALHDYRQATTDVTHAVAGDTIR